jgi:hypothetical protein
MRAVRRAAIVLTVSLVLAAGLWFAADVVGDPTPRAMEPGLGQPAIAGLKDTVTFLAAGTVAWAACWVLSRVIRLVAR